MASTGAYPRPGRARFRIRRRTTFTALVATVGLLAGAGSTAGSASAQTTSGALSTTDNTPFPASTLITGASWTTARYGPPANQFGDILSTSSLDASSLYVMMDDGGTGTTQPAQWRNSLAHVTGSPPNLTFSSVGDPGPAKTLTQVNSNEDGLGGLLGDYYSTGFTAVGGTFYATQVNDWNWNANDPFQGLAGIAYSTDQGKSWAYPRKPFTGPTGNLNFVQYGANATAPDGYVYAIATEREFNASTMILGRARADAADITDPARWQWAAATDTRDGRTQTTWTNTISRAKPVLEWTNHITYPRMSYDAGLHRYLLTFTYSYTNTTPGVWKNGSELVILEAPTPAGPFSFVARQPYFGPSNGYDPAIPVNWMSAGGTDMWLIWGANFTGCSSGLDCSGAYGFNLQRLQLTVSRRAGNGSAGGDRPTGPGAAGLCRRNQRCPRRRRHSHAALALAPTRRRTIADLPAPGEDESVHA